MRTIIVFIALVFLSGCAPRMDAAREQADSASMRRELALILELSRRDFMREHRAEIERLRGLSDDELNRLIRGYQDLREMRAR